VNGNPSSDTLTAQFLIEGVNAADDFGTLDLTLRSTPLPPALPLFALALLALGLFGYARTNRDVTPAHGQAY
jgi:hypothetical protein